jgi:hypothetical protein
MHTSRFYIFLGIYYGYAYEVKRALRAEIEYFFASIGVNICQCDVRQSHGFKYHMFINIVFQTSLERSEWVNRIDPETGSIINGKWRIFHYITRRERQQQLNNGFYEDDSYHTPSVNAIVSTNNNTVFQEEQEEVKAIPVVEENDDSMDEYESIYKWLITAQQTELQREIEEIKETARWLATPYWERNRAHATPI